MQASGISLASLTQGYAVPFPDSSTLGMSPKRLSTPLQRADSSRSEERLVSSPHVQLHAKRGAEYLQGLQLSMPHTHLPSLPSFPCKTPVEFTQAATMQDCCICIGGSATLHCSYIPMHWAYMNALLVPDSCQHVCSNANPGDFRGTESPPWSPRRVPPAHLWGEGPPRYPGYRSGGAILPDVPEGTASSGISSCIF